MSRFCSDCKHNVVQAHDILMGKIELEGSENEEEFDEVRRDDDFLLRSFFCGVRAMVKYFFLADQSRQGSLPFVRLLFIQFA